MKKFVVIVLVCLFASCKTDVAPSGEFDASLAWWKEARFGMFIHWGLSSLTGEEISWSRTGYGAEKYDRLALRFNPYLFDANQWVSVAENAGMKYIVLTAKHHDGFCLWDSKANPHNIMNTPYGKDVCKQLADAAHSRGMRIGWYFSCREWSDSTCSDESLNYLYIDKMKGELQELLSNYGKIDLLWFDYDGYPSPADPKEIFDLCRSIQPDIVINNRLYPLHPNESHAYTGNVGMYATPEQFVGGYGEVPWETCSTSATSRQWSIRYGDTPRPSQDMVWELIGAAGGNGNLLMNVGPDSLGVIGDDYALALAEMGNWINSNKGVLYGTVGGPWKPTENYVSTRNGKTVNIVLRHGNDFALPVTEEIKFSKTYLLSSGDEVDTKVVDDTLFFVIPEDKKGSDNLVIRVDMDKEDIALIAPFSTSHSLAYNKPCSASSSLSDLYMHCPSSAFDDSNSTTWISGRRSDYDSSAFYGHYVHFNAPEGFAPFDTEGWLQVDLERVEAVSSFKIVVNSTIGHIELQYKENDDWITVASSDNIAGTWEGNIETSSASIWRLNMSQGASQFGIREFQLF